MEKSEIPFDAAAAAMINIRPCRRTMEEIIAEDNKLIQSGAFIEKPKKNIWKECPIFYYILLVSSIIGVIVLCAMISRAVYWSRYSYTTEFNVYISCWVICVAILMFVSSKFLDLYIDNQSFKITPPNGDKPDSLSTTNYIGTSLFGSFRCTGWSGVSYVFLTIFLPIIPIGCYRVRKGMTTYISRKKQETTFTVFGSEASIGLEILYIYMRYYSVATFIGGIIGIMAAFNL